MAGLLRRWWWLPPLALLFLIAWGPAPFGPFHFDDDLVVVHYAPVHSLAAWWEAQPGLRPLLKLSYALNWQAGTSATGFHLVNLALHALNGVLALLWLRRVLPPAMHTAAGWAVALWLLHPSTTEAVTYVSGRSVSLAATATLGALLASARGAPWLAALCTALALGVRETAATIPLLLALVAWLRGGDLRDAWRAAWPALAVTLLAAGAFLLEPHHRRLLAATWQVHDAATQLWTQAEAWRWLAGQALTLGAPNIDPDLRPATAPTAAGVLTLATLVALGALAVHRVVRWRCRVAGGFLLAALCLLPGYGLLARADVANDRHLYLPLLFLLAGALPAAGARLAAWPAWRGAALALLLLWFAAGTALRNLDYLDAVTLWRITATQSPQKSRVWNNLGDACRTAGDLACAEAAYRRAAVLDPANLRARANLYFLGRERAE